MNSQKCFELFMGKNLKFRKKYEEPIFLVLSDDRKWCMTHLRNMVKKFLDIMMIVKIYYDFFFCSLISQQSANTEKSQTLFFFLDFQIFKKYISLWSLGHFQIDPNRLNCFYVYWEHKK